MPEITTNERDAMLTKEEMLEQYKVLGFAYGRCIVQRKSDGKRGTLDFTEGANRRYHNFWETDEDWLA